MIDVVRFQNVDIKVVATDIRDLKNPKPARTPAFRPVKACTKTPITTDFLPASIILSVMLLMPSSASPAPLATSLKACCWSLAKSSRAASASLIALFISWKERLTSSTGMFRMEVTMAFMVAAWDFMILAWA